MPTAARRPSPARSCSASRSDGHSWRCSPRASATDRTAGRPYLLRCWASAPQDSSSSPRTRRRSTRSDGPGRRFCSGLVFWMIAQTRRQAAESQAFLAALSRVRRDGVLCRRLRLSDRGGRLRRHTRTRRRRPAHRRRRHIGSTSAASGRAARPSVLEPGLGESASAIARRIAPEVARATRVCVYDRAGHGRSDVAPNADAARDLHVLLERAHVPGPYVMAGHSLGGPLVLSYADRYPSQVGGVVLLDSMHPHQTHTRCEPAWVPCWRWSPHSHGPASLVCSSIRRTGADGSNPDSSFATSSRCPPS